VVPSTKQSKWASLLGFCSAAACSFYTTGFNSPVTFIAFGVALELCISPDSIATRLSEKLCALTYREFMGSWAWVDKQKKKGCPKGIRLHVIFNFFIYRFLK
jgi:hypothetical protein